MNVPKEIVQAANGGLYSIAMQETAEAIAKWQREKCHKAVYAAIYLTPLAAPREIQETKMHNTKEYFLKSILKDGEQYAGLLLGKDGAQDQHIILIPGESQAVNWDEAKKFATKAGGELPTRREQSLLFANLPEEFEKNWYWSGEQRGSGSAWFQGFGYGYQYWTSSLSRYRARAVRRVAIAGE